MRLNKELGHLEVEIIYSISVQWLKLLSECDNY